MFAQCALFQYILVSLSQDRLFNHFKHNIVSVHTTLWTHFLRSNYMALDSKIFDGNYYPGNTCFGNNRRNITATRKDNKRSVAYMWCPNPFATLTWPPELCYATNFINVAAMRCHRTVTCISDDITT